MRDVINIVLASDDNYAQHVAVLVVSVLSNTKVQVKGFNYDYYYYLHQTKFSDVKMPQPGKNMKGKSIARQMVQLKIADFWQWVLGRKLLFYNQFVNDII